MSKQADEEPGSADVPVGIRTREFTGKNVSDGTSTRARADSQEKANDRPKQQNHGEQGHRQPKRGLHVGDPAIAKPNILLQAIPITSIVLTHTSHAQARLQLAQKGNAHDKNSRDAEERSSRSLWTFRAHVQTAPPHHKTKT